MMRNFPNFLDAYMEYAADEFCPSQFHYWTGLSIIAGALERKVWTKQALVTHYPNIYTLLVSHPGVGKSTALDRGVDLLEDIKANLNPEIKIIPEQITEPALLDMMGKLGAFQIGSTVIQHSSGYFHASEASSSALQNLFGDFNACITAMYDCPKRFRKKIKSESKTTEIINVCFNIIAGSTFDYLKKLVNEDSVMGGLASRFIYVICKDRIVREPKWHAIPGKDLNLRAALIQDLAEINKLKGGFTPTPGFVAAWEKWQPDFDRFLISLNSSRMESIMARKSTNLMKVCMLLSVSEGNSLELNESHWEKGVQIIEDVTKDNAHIISSAIIANTDSQAGLNQLILQYIRNQGGLVSSADLRGVILKQGSDISKFNPTIEFLARSGRIGVESVRDVLYIRLLGNPDTDL